MAEAVAGLVISGVGLAALATTVLDCFERVDTGRKLGKDYEHYSLQLEMAQLAYGRWLEAVKITDAGAGALPANVPVASDTETKAVQRLLGGIELAFDEAKDSNQRYQGQLKTEYLSTSSSASDQGRADLAVRVKDRVKKMQRSVSVLDKVRWVVHDSKAFQTLTERVSTNVGTLTTMFPVVTQRQHELAAIDVADIAPPGDSRRLDLLQAEAKSTDLILNHMVTEAKRQGHYYDTVTLTDQAKALYGDELAMGARDPGTRNEYRNTFASGTTRVVYGNRVGMKDFLAD